MSGVPGVPARLPLRLSVCKAGQAHIKRQTFLLDEAGQAILYAAQAAVNRCYEKVDFNGVTISVSGNIEGNEKSRNQRPVNVKVEVSGVSDSKAKAEVEKVLKQIFEDKCRFDGSGTTFSGSVSI
jgi:hypothetical protein